MVPGGTEWTVGSTRQELRVDVCANCHPFFTGTQNIIDTAGQVEAVPEAPGASGPNLGGERPQAPDDGELSGSPFDSSPSGVIDDTR